MTKILVVAIFKIPPFFNFVFRTSEVAVKRTKSAVIKKKLHCLYSRQVPAPT